MSPDTGTLELLRARLDALEDKEEIRDLLTSYFRGFEAKLCDDVWLRTIFTEDVKVHFPAGQHTGLPGLGDAMRRIVELWDRTLHALSEHVIELADDGARVHAVLHASHIHRRDDPGADLHIGGYVDAAAVPSPGGWRLRTLTIRLVWTAGDGPRPTD